MDAAAILGRWNALPARVRVGLGVLLSALILAGIAAAVLAHPPTVALFAQPLAPDQVSDVQEQLAAWNVPFTPVSDNVLVAPARRNALLLRLSMAGVPRTHVDASRDVLGKLGALTPQSVIDAQTRDGLAGDIELALRGMSGIEDAAVIIAPAHEGDFAGEGSRAATASVRLHLAPGSVLSPGAVDGIRSFVAASVPGLDPGRVTLVDDRGVALTQSQDGGDAASLQQSLQSALDAAVGAGSTIVRVRVERDATSVASRDTRRSPLSQLPITARVQSESFSGQGKRYGRSERQVERGSETRETTTTAQPGRIARISAAIIVDSARGVDLQLVRSMASAALGADPRRGDTVDVEAIPFAHARAAKKDGWWLAYGAVVPLLPTLAVAIATLLALRWARAPLGTFARAFLERSRIERGMRRTSGLAAANVRGALLEEPPHAAAAIISALPAATAAAVLEMYPEHERAAIVKRMQRPVPPLLADAERALADA